MQHFEHITAESIADELTRVQNEFRPHHYKYHSDRDAPTADMAYQVRYSMLFLTTFLDSGLIRRLKKTANSPSCYGWKHLVEDVFKPNTHHIWEGAFIIACRKLNLVVEQHNGSFFVDIAFAPREIEDGIANGFRGRYHYRKVKVAEDLCKGLSSINLERIDLIRNMDLIRNTRNDITNLPVELEEMILSFCVPR